VDTTPNRVGIVGRNKLNWRKTADGYALHLGRSQKAMLKIVPDKVWPGMWRILHRDCLSDMVNLSRAKDAGFSIALGVLNHRQETRPVASHARLFGRG
jgi:predicted amino acid racemase